MIPNAKQFAAPMAKRERGMAAAETGHQPEFLAGPLKLAKAIRDRGNTTSDDLYDDLKSAASLNEQNWVGAAINGLARSGVIYRSGEARSKRATRRGSRIGVYRPTCPLRLAQRIAELERSLAEIATATRFIGSGFCTSPDAQCSFAAVAANSGRSGLELLVPLQAYGRQKQ